MRAVVNTPGGPAPVSIQVVPEPSPSAHEFVVEVAAFSINRGELSLIRFRPEGWRPGQDIAGIVLEAAADGSGPPVGTRIVGIVEGGGWSERVAVSSSQYAALPEAVTFEQAASLPIAGLTALRTLRLGGNLLGRQVMITGANGGVGRFVIELGAAAGAAVTAVTSRADKADELRQLGARHVVATIAEAEGSFTLILESLGGTFFEEAVRKLEPRGTIVPMGLSTGETPKLNLMDFIGREGAKVQTFMSYASGYPDDADLSILVDLIAAGTLHPTIGHTGSWLEIPSALQRLADRQLPGGKLILTID